MKNLTKIEIETSGHSLVKLKQLSLEEINISDHHTLWWAMDILDSYGPSPLESFQHYWASEQLAQLAPTFIDSEQDTTNYCTISLLEPALTTTIVLHAQHLELALKDAQGFPHGKWQIADFSTTGRNGRTDRAVMRTSQQRRSEWRVTTVCQGKTHHVCCIPLDGGISVLGSANNLPNTENKIPMDGPGTSVLQWPKGDLNWHVEPWKKKLQKFMFQVCI
jgi:hypothetical protein